MDTKRIMLALGDISPTLPFLFRWIVTAAAVLLAWAVISVIAYWIYQVVGPVVIRASLKLTAIRLSLFGSATTWFSRRKLPVDQFVEAHAQALALNNDNTQLCAAIVSTQQAVASLPGSIAALDLSLNSARDQVTRSTTSVERLQYPAAVEAPSPDEFLLVQVGANQSLLTAVAFAFFSVVLIGVNTLMLNEFFVTFFPPLKIAGVKLSLVGACLFSIVEFAAGAGMAFVDGDDRVATAKRIALGMVVLVLGSIEFGLYAKFGQGFGFNPFSDLFAEGTTGGAVMKSWFGVFGPAVVFTMAWCGDMLFVGIRGLSKNRAAAQWRAYLRLREKAADYLQARLLNSANAVEVLRRTLNDVNRAFLDTSGDKALAAKIDAAREQFSAAIEAAKAVPMEDVKPLTRSEMVRLFVAQIFICLSCCLAVGFIILMYSPWGIGTSVLVSGVDKPSALIAVLECAILLGAGYVSTRAGNHIQVGLKSSSATGWARWPLLIFVAALVAAILVANAFFIFAHQTAIEAMWFSFVAAACLWLFRCGQSVGLMLAASWTLFAAVAIILVAAVLWCAGILIGCLVLLLALVNVAMLILRFPYLRWTERKEEAEAPVGAVREQA